MQNWYLAQWHPKAVAMGPGAPLGRPLAATCLKRYRFWDHFGSPLAPLGRRWFRPFIKGRETRFYWKNLYKSKVFAPPPRVISGSNFFENQISLRISSHEVHRGLFGRSGLAPGEPNVVALKFFAHFWADPDFYGRSAGLQKSPFSSKSFKKARSPKSSPRSPGQFWNFLDFGTISVPFWICFLVFFHTDVGACLYMQIINCLPSFRATPNQHRNENIVITRNIFYVVRVWVS